MLSPVLPKRRAFNLSIAAVALLLASATSALANEPPSPNPDHYTVHGIFSTPLDSPPYGVLKNDTDPDGDFLSCVFSAVNTTVGTALIFANGRVDFIAASGKTGSATVPYTVCDTRGLCADSTVTFDVINQAPAATPDDYTFHRRFDSELIDSAPPFGVLRNDSDPDGDPLSCVPKQVFDPLGTANIFANGRVTFIPNPGQTGDTTITYTVCDNLGLCSEGTVAFHVLNEAPDAQNDTYPVRSMVFATPFENPWGALKNDSDVEGDPLLLTFSRVDFPQGTGLVFATGQVNFVRNDNYRSFSGSLNMQYTLCDDLGACSQATVTFLLIGLGENNGGCGRCNESVGSPVKVSNGNMYLQQNDYHVAGVEALSISRTYNSDSQTVGLFGRGWSTQYDEAVTGYDQNLLSFLQSDGRVVYFSRPATSDDAFTDLIGDYHARVSKDSSGSTLTLKDGGSKRFNLSGKLVSASDRNGNTISLSYDANGLLSAVTDPFGRVLTINTNASGLVTAISDGLGIIATYAYGNAGELLSVTYADNSAYNFSYDGNLRLTAVTDALGDVLEAHSYDALGRAITSEKQGGVDRYSLNYLSDTETEVTDGLGHVTKYTFDTSKGRNVVTRVEGLCSCGGGGGSQVQTWTFDDQLNVTAITDALGHTLSYTYDADGNQLTATDASGTVTYTYNEFGEILTRTNQLGAISTNTYDAAGNLSTVTNALGKMSKVTYDVHGMPLTVTDARGKVTTFVYDATGNLAKRTDALNHSTEFAYDARGRLLSSTNALGNMTSFSYDAFGRVNLVTRADGTTMTYEYDLAGRRIAVIDAKGNRSTSTYDAAYRLTSQTDAAGQTNTYAYDVMSNLVSTTDALGRVINYEYDEFNRLEKTIYPPATAGAPRLFEALHYDQGGNVIERIDTAGRVTTYSYDDSNRVTSSTDAANQTTQFEYDALSRMTALVDALNQRYRFNYDPIGRLRKMHRGQDVMSFTYDAVGNRKTRTDYNGAVTEYTYDAVNRLKTILYPDSSSVSYTYDKLSRLQTATNETGTVNFDYNRMNRLTTATDVFGQVVTYNYDANGNRTKLSLNNAVVGTYKYDAIDRLTKILDAAGATFTFDYDAANRLTQKKAPNNVKTAYQYDGLDRLTRLLDTKGVNSLADRQYQYNDAGQITQIAEPTLVRNFAYDAVDRLTAVSYSNPALPTETYAYDGTGNRTSSQNGAYGYQKFNRLVSTASATYSSDANGNLISKTDATGTTQFVWDFENRLRQVTLPNGASVNYKYDALGRRIQRAPSLGVAANFVYDGQEVIRDVNTNGSTVDYVNGPGVDNKLRLNDSRLNGPLYFMQDQLGSTTALTNASGAVSAQVSYDSFGNPITGTNLTRYTYTGREYDTDTGLYYYRARWYDAKLGRFISEDPIGFAGGVNQFRYVGNNPMNITDPSGLFNEDVHYYLTYFIASKFSCFTADEARLIADADQSTDDNDETSPQPGFTIIPVIWGVIPNKFAQHKNAEFHAFNPGNHVFMNSHWKDACSGKANYVGMGRLLHYLQDTFSHGGFENPVIGQTGFNGVDPPIIGGLVVDNTNWDISKSADMARNTLFALLEFAKHKDCNCSFQDMNTWWPQVAEFLRTSNSRKERKREILDVPLR